MRILITGGGGFIGQALAASLMKDASVQSLILTDVVQPSVPAIPKIDSDIYPTVQALKADLTSRTVCEKILTSDLTHVYLLHGIMSGAAEANLELGLAVNVDSMRHVMDVLRKVKPGIRVIFPSSLAVFGPTEAGTVITESTMPLPQSSYGAQKQVCEVLLNDFSRRGLLDARIVRLPTIIVRPGKPSGAASSFCSGILREPLNGEKSVLPVSRDLKLWVCSTRTITANLLMARDIPSSAFGNGSRIVNLPGITVTVQEMLDALKNVAGEKVASLIEEAPGDNVGRIVGSWPAEFDITRATSLGYQKDGSLVQTIREYIEDYR